MQTVLKYRHTDNKTKYFVLQNDSKIKYESAHKTKSLKFAISRMANGNGKWQMWHFNICAISGKQTSYWYWCPKVSEFYKETNYEV